MRAVAPPQVFGAPARQLSRAEYDRLVQLGFFERERVELIHGMVVQMAPAGPLHAEIVTRLSKRFVLPLGDRARARVRSPYVAVDDSEPEPDVAVVPERSYTSGHPEEAFLVVEVAESSLDYDRETKAPLYAASRVAEYWIVDIAGKAIEVYTKPEDGRFTSVQRFGLGDVVHVGAFPDVSVAVRDLVE